MPLATGMCGTVRVGNSGFMSPPGTNDGIQHIAGGVVSSEEIAELMPALKLIGGTSVPAPHGIALDCAAAHR